MKYINSLKHQRLNRRPQQPFFRIPHRRERWTPYPEGAVDANNNLCVFPRLRFRAGLAVYTAGRLWDSPCLGIPGISSKVRVRSEGLQNAYDSTRASKPILNGRIGWKGLGVGVEGFGGGGTKEATLGALVLSSGRSSSENWGR